MGHIDLEVEGLGFGYSAASKVLEGISLKVSGPQLVSIIGPNGVGKSTLIYCLNKILSPSSSSITTMYTEPGGILPGRPSSPTVSKSTGTPTATMFWTTMT
ncbi:MAG: ATP-binding cassette domain-containing protein [Candidatus Methanomethylophilaceae archaeon]|nr:ATP-binding cassette domain-containing protein [Candidatus Methanomethylophilaceae archaeon]